MKNLAIKAVIQKLEYSDIQVDEYKENDKLCGYELNTYTNGGVNKLIFLDFRDTKLNPKSGKDFLQVYNERIKDIDIDDEIQTNRQDKRYVADFSLSESIEDFTDWKNKLENIFTSSLKTPQQR